MLHRDLKAENILIDNEFKPHKTDFGLSKFFDSRNSQFQSMFCCGTIEYMAPEVMDGDGFNTKADVYSFGILMYEVITGLRAYCENNKEEDIFRFMRNIRQGTRPKFPKGYQIKDNFKELINRCWSSDPKERPIFSEIYKMLSLSDSKYGNSYCLENVDTYKLSLYIDEITTNNKDKNENENDKQRNLENEINELKTCNKKIEEEKKKLKIENLKLKNDDEQMNKMISKTQNENLKLKNDNEQMSKTISKTQNENLKLKNDNEQMNKMISKTQNEN